MFQKFLFLLQNIVKLKGCVTHRIRKTRVKNPNTKNAVYDGIKPFIAKKSKKISFFSFSRVSFVKFVKQITLLRGARSFAYFDTKLSFIAQINITMHTVAAQMFIAAWLSTRDAARFYFSVALSSTTYASSSDGFLIFACL
ncbi:hypothetical protein T4D_13531 [Trichinella pseudospiralis]|uniref:Uncharacterized protein n=1 Tax=Trichinella pseudospiralis TaxID=6337 RepID=A0A0V1G628_TRIPS|nr:hypothetical protein T4D_13531 [Trichinella pseudospiralis]